MQTWTQTDSKTSYICEHADEDVMRTQTLFHYKSITVLMTKQHAASYRFSVSHLRTTNQADLLTDRTLIQSRPGRSYTHDTHNTGEVICNLSLQFTHQMQKETETEHKGLFIYLL